MKEELERKRRELESSHAQGLEWRLTQFQEQVTSMQSHRTTGELSSIWTPPLPVGSIKPPRLCPKLFANNNDESKSETELSSIGQTNDGPKSNVANVLMQTASAVVRNGEKGSSSTIRLILDSGSQHTYITKELAKELKLKLSEPKELSVITFGVSQPKNIQCHSSQLQLVLKDENTLTLNVNVVPSITGKITRFPLNPDDVEF